jgi:hypothetical protein
MKSKIMITLAAGVMALGAFAAQPADAHCHYDRHFCRGEWRGAYVPPGYYRQARWEGYRNPYGNGYGYGGGVRGLLSRFF